VAQATLEPTPEAPSDPDSGISALRRWLARHVRLVGWLAGAVAVVLAAALALWLAHPSGSGAQAPEAKVPPNWIRPAVSAEGLAQTTGVKIRFVAESGGGGLLDLRFTVLDPDKAHTIHDAKTPPAIIDERSGIVLDRLFMGHSHTGPFKPAVTYYLVFENTGNWVHRGSKVTVLLGNAQVEHVVVQ
jgi:hypothetical protein